MATAAIQRGRWYRAHLVRCLVALMLGGVMVLPAQAVEDPPPPEATASDPPERDEPKGPVDEYDRGVPQTSVRGYLVACRDGDFERAAAYLDLRRIPENRRTERGPALARQLKIVLDRTLWVDWEALSSDAEGYEDEGLPWYRDVVGVIHTSAGPVTVYVDRVPRGDGVRVWKISGATLGHVPELYDEFGYGALEQYVPQKLLDVHFVELALWQWIGLLVALVVAWLTSYFAASGLLAVSRPLVRRSKTDLDDHVLDATAGPLRTTLAIGVFHLLTLSLGLSLVARRFLTGAEQTLVIFSVAWILFRLSGVLSRHFERRLVGRGQAAAARFMPLGQNVLKVLIVIAAFLAAVDSFGFNVWGFVASLGVGGIAIALAAQKSIENFFGGIFLIVDEPVRPGDFCRFGDKIGTIEEIGLRSTRIRTLDRTVVTVSNAEFSSLQIENFAKRDRIRFFTVLGLRYETRPDQLRHVLAAIRRLLLSHPKVDPEPARVRFIGFGAFSLDLEIYAYVRTSDWNEFLAIREDLLLRLMDVVEESGSGFAFPSETHYVAQDDGLDTERGRLAEEEIQKLRKKDALPLPDYAEQTKAGLANSLDYPPRGSAVAKD